MLLWLLLKLSTIRFSASPLMPPCACHQVIFAAGLTSLPGAFGPVSAAGPPPPPPVPPPQAAASKVSPSASAPSLRIFPSSGWPLTCHRTRGQAADQLALRQPEQGPASGTATMMTPPSGRPARGPVSAARSLRARGRARRGGPPARRGERGRSRAGARRDPPPARRTRDSSAQGPRSRAADRNAHRDSDRP